MNIDDIKPCQRNPRKMGDNEMARLCESIERDPDFMRLRPIVIDKAGEIIGGNQRWKACKRLGMKTIPDEWIVKAESLTPEQRKRFILVDNAPEGMAGAWDMPILMDEWSVPELEMVGFELPDDPEPTGSDESYGGDEAEKLRAKWGTAPGQLWIIGPHRILCGSCTEPENWKRLMLGEKAVLCNTDPPYGVSFIGVLESGNGKISAPKPMLKEDNKREDDLLASLLVPSLRLAAKHTTDDAAFYVWHAFATRRDFERALDTIGLSERQYITWVKDAFVLGHADYHQQTEAVFYANKIGQPCRWFGTRDQATVWRIRPPSPCNMAASIANGIRLSDGAGNQVFIAPKAPKARKTRLIRLNEGESFSIATEHASDAWEIKRDPAKDRLHPTQKPVRLFEIAIRNHTEKGDLIVEPFSGAGGNFIAARRLGRRCYGMDLDPKYVAVTLERMSQEGEQGILEK